MRSGTYISSAEPLHEADEQRRQGIGCRWASRRVCSWLSGSAFMPSARFVIAETAATRRPQWRATAVSWTVDIPTASAPSVAYARISAGVSKVGPETAR